MTQLFSTISGDAVTGVILAGGLARRMGGGDKGIIELAGRPMIEYVIEAVKPQVDQLLINANRSHQRYSAYNLPIIPDSLKGFSGPLAGIAAALETSVSKLVMTVPCDGPWVPDDLCARLRRRLEISHADVCVAHDGNRVQPVFALFRTSLLPNILDFLASGDRKLHYWLSQQNFACEDFSDRPEAFVNVNTHEERLRVEQRLLAGR